MEKMHAHCMVAVYKHKKSRSN